MCSPTPINTMGLLVAATLSQRERERGERVCVYDCEVHIEKERNSVCVCLRERETDREACQSRAAASCVWAVECARTR
jgi:hypothetical protein